MLSLPSNLPNQTNPLNTQVVNTECHVVMVERPKNCETISLMSQMTVPG